MNYFDKYVKYKNKYLNAKKLKTEVNLFSEQNYLDAVLKYFNITSPVNLSIAKVPSNQIYPDIWIVKNNGTYNLKDSGYNIYVTHEWLRQPKFEKQKRIVHEVLHILGENHWEKSTPVLSKSINTSVSYSTYPKDDTFSLLVWYNLYQNGIN